MKALVASTCAIGFALAPAGALAQPPQWVLVIRDCAFDGKIDGHYSHAALAQALKRVPSDGDEYTDCTNAIARALQGGSGKTDAPPANGVVTASGAVAASPDDATRLQAVITSADAGTVPAPPPEAARTDRRAAAPALVLDRLGSPGATDLRLDTSFLAAFLAVWLVLTTSLVGFRRLSR